jgi:peroxiredoxin
MAATIALTGMIMMGTASAKPEIGKPAPDFTVADTNGKMHKLGDLQGKTVVLEWTNHECPYVKKHYAAGNMQKLQREAANEGVVWLTVISSAKGEQGHLGGAEANALTAGRKAAPSAVLLDESGAMGRAYDARTTPHMFVIDKNGALAYMGGIDDKPTTNAADIEGATNYVALALRNLAASKPADPAVTRPYGCSVKYGS